MTHFNNGWRVFWQAGGDVLFRDHNGKVHPISLATIRDVRRRLWIMARDATGRERDRLCVLWAEADETHTDTLRWREAACGNLLIREQVA